MSLYDKILDRTLKTQAIRKLSERSSKEARIKCPMKPKMEVIWVADSYCSFSGRSTCKKCIKKGDYPK